MGIEWISVEDGMPISGPGDARYSAPFHEDDIYVLVNGVQQEATFWACWEECWPMDDQYQDNSEFIMEFDVEGVTHWRFIE